RAVDADHFTVDVDERTTGIARIDRGVGLDEVLNGVLVTAGKGQLRATLRTDDPRGDREVEAERISDGNDPLAHARYAIVAERHDRKIVRVNLDERDVGGWIATDNFRREGPIVEQPHGDAIGVGYD